MSIFTPKSACWPMVSCSVGLLMKKGKLFSPTGQIRQEQAFRPRQSCCPKGSVLIHYWMFEIHDLISTFCAFSFLFYFYYGNFPSLGVSICLPFTWKTVTGYLNNKHRYPVSKVMHREQTYENWNKYHSAGFITRVALYIQTKLEVS